MVMPRKAKNIQLLNLASEALEPLLDELVFVGGATTGLLITDPAAPDIRETQDVDVIVEVQHHSEYHQLEQTLFSMGLQPDPDEDAPLCRFKKDELLLDIMPTDESILGFSNPWYQAAIQTAASVTLGNGKNIRHVTAAYFIGTKLAAFEGRGRQDFLASHDFEDIVAVINGRAELIEDISNSEKVLREYVAACVRSYLAQSAFQQALPGLVIEGPERAPIIIERLESIARIG